MAQAPKRSKLEPARVWRDLAGGQYAIQRYYDEGSRRYFVLRAAGEEPLLTERQRLIIAYRAYCQTLAKIAVEFRVSVATVVNQLTAAFAKLGLERDMDLVVIFGVGLRSVSGGTQGRPLKLPPMTSLRRWVKRAPFATPRGMSAVAGVHRGKPAVVLSYPLAAPDWWLPLTPAEIDVASDVLAGLTNARISEKRGSARRTVVNQVAAVFWKLGVRSRLELALAVLAGRHWIVERPKRAKRKTKAKAKAKRS